MADPRGLYQKFVVKRTDGSDRPGQKHHGCAYFVLDLAHDKHARAALRAYAKSCRKDRPELARDLRELASLKFKRHGGDSPYGMTRSETATLRMAFPRGPTIPKPRSRKVIAERFKEREDAAPRKKRK